ncbi:MAG: Hsp70 family protein [Phycisphaerae bacterium]|jgi:molecular chaperone DnaK (HSP70)
MEIVSVGIDLGTTNSVVAIKGSSKPQVLFNTENKPRTPSVVGPIRTKHKKSSIKDEVLIGDMALSNWENTPEDTIVSIRDLMGRSVTDPVVEKIRRKVLYQIVPSTDGSKDSVSVVMSGKQYSPVEISAMILRKLKEDTEFRLGKRVTHAVITIPAYFAKAQRKATLRAANLAGLKVLKLLNEPTAVAIAFGLDSKSGDVPKKILVYDLDKETFDVSALMWDGGDFVLLNTGGDMWLGGDDFDQVIVNKALRYISSEYGINAKQNKSFMVMLKKEARAAKERLSDANSTELIVNGLRNPGGDLIDVDVEITRPEFEQMIQPLVDRTIRLMANTYTLSNAFSLARMTGSGRVPPPDYVIVKGGSTKIPLIRRTLQNMFGAEKLLSHIEAEYFVAMGAAIVAAQWHMICCPECESFNDLKANRCTICGTSLEVQETEENDIIIGAPFHYGVQSTGDDFNTFINKNDPYPTPIEMRKSLPYHTRIPNQRTIRIPVYGGHNLKKASTNEKQGEVFAILPPGLPLGSVVLIKFWLDANGIFDLSAHLEDGTALKPWIIHGELDHKAVEELDILQEELSKWEKNATPEQSDKVDKAVAEAYELIEDRKIEDAVRLIEQVWKELKIV